MTMLHTELDWLPVETGVSNAPADQAGVAQPPAVCQKMGILRRLRRGAAVLMLSLSFALPINTAHAVMVPTIEPVSIPTWLAQLQEALVQSLIQTAMQTLMQEANKLLGPLFNLPVVGGFFSTAFGALSEQATAMVDSEVKNMFNPKIKFQNFNDCASCVASLQQSANLQAQLASGEVSFSVLPASALGNLRNYGSVGGRTTSTLPLAGPAVCSGTTCQATTTGGSSISFVNPGGNNSFTTLPAGTVFTTTDAQVDLTNFSKATFTIGDGAITFGNLPTEFGSNPTLDAANMTFSTVAINAFKKAQTTNTPQTVNGVTFKPCGASLNNGSGGLSGDISGCIDYNGATVKVGIGTDGASISSSNLDKALCPTLTDDDKAGGKVCQATGAAVSGLLGCASRGFSGDCAKNIGTNLASGLLNSLLGGVTGTDGKTVSTASSNVSARQNEIYREYFSSGTPTIEDQATYSRKRNQKCTEATVAMATAAEQQRSTVMDNKKKCDEAGDKAVGDGSNNSIGGAEYLLRKCYKDLDVLSNILKAKEMEANAWCRLPSLPIQVDVTDVLSGTG